MCGGHIRIVLMASAAWLAGIGFLLYRGLSDDTVQNAIRPNVELGRQLTEMTGNPRFLTDVETAKKQRDQITDEADRMFAALKKINRRDPLMTNVFPNGGSPVDRLRYMEVYHEALLEMCEALNAGGPPTPAEVAEMRLELEERGFAKTQTGGGPHPKQVKIGQLFSRGGDDLAEKYANILKARSIGCYATPKTFSREPLAEEGRPPSVENLWFVQVEFWIQQDVVKALAAFNGELDGSDADARGVERNPVKHIHRVIAVGYQTREGVALISWPNSPTREDSIPVKPVFTKQACDAVADVVVFEVYLTIDQRELLRIIDAISDANLMQCTLIQTAVSPKRNQGENYIYGDAPVIDVMLEFEAYFLCDLYRPMMPANVRARLGI